MISPHDKFPHLAERVIAPGDAKCSHAPTNGVGVPTHLENEIRTASRLRTPGFALVFGMESGSAATRMIRCVCCFFAPLRLSHLEPEKIAYSD